MPFLTRNPSYYLSALKEVSTDPLHIGLYLDENAAHRDEDQAESAIIAASSWVELATAIQRTSRSIRCLWLRIKGDADGDDDGNNDDVAAAFRALGQGLVGATAIESLVIEDQGMGKDQMMCIQEYLARNTTLRGIKFLRTHLDAPSSLLLNDFLVGNSALRVLDLTDNPRVDDATVKGVLGAILRNSDCRIETLNIFEKLEGEADANIGITMSGVDFVTSFVSQTPSLSILRLRIRELNNAGLGDLAKTIRRKDCNIARLEISGRFGDEGMLSIADALKTNRSLRTIDVGMSERITDRGGRTILQVAQGQDKSWQSKTTSNHKLQSVYISDRAGSNMSKSLLTKLQTITAVDPHRTLQNKAWDYIDNNIEDLSAIGLEVKLAPHFLSFVSNRGGIDALFNFMHSRNNAPELIFGNPTPERLRLAPQIEKAKQENAVLRALLKSERKVRQTIRSENSSLRDLEEREQHQGKDIARCLLLPFFKCLEMWQSYTEPVDIAPSLKKELLS